MVVVGVVVVDVAVVVVVVVVVVAVVVVVEVVVAVVVADVVCDDVVTDVDVGIESVMDVVVVVAVDAVDRKSQATSPSEASTNKAKASSFFIQSSQKAVTTLYHIGKRFQARNAKIGYNRNEGLVKL